MQPISKPPISSKNIFLHPCLCSTECAPINAAITPIFLPYERYEKYNSTSLTIAQILKPQHPLTSS